MMFDFKRSHSEISFSEFLHFLRAAYQINGNTANKFREVGTVCQDVGSQSVTSQMELNDATIKKSTQMSKRKSAKPRRARVKSVGSAFHQVKKSSSFPLETPKVYGRDSASDIHPNRKLDVRQSVEFLMKCKLNQAIEEGLLDLAVPSFVPKLGIPTVQEDKKIQTEVARKPSKKTFQQQEQKKKKTIVKRKSISEMSEVEIHVCDEANHLKKDFKCSQNLLMTKMEYFAELARGQNLENMDITVHCDVAIFEWLMKWVKKSANSEGASLEIDVANVVPLVVSAEFFQMRSLFEDCLVFFRHNVTEILETSKKLHYLNDNTISRLAELFSNSELEELHDPNGKLKNKMFRKLIATLAAPTPDVARGHYASLASLYRCVSCGKLMLWHLSSEIPCHPKNMHVDICGDIESRHIRDTSWSLSEHVKQLRHELRSWRAVYWRLWAECHFLRCSACDSYFPVHQASWCLHHPHTPQFFPAEKHSTAAYPIGRYPCCGERAYRFEILPHQSGCQFKSHTPVLETIRDLAVHAIFESKMGQIALEPPQLMFPERITYFISPNDCSDPDHRDKWKPYWWEGLELAPAAAVPCSLLSKSWNSEHKGKDAGNDHPRSGTEMDSDEDPSRRPKHLHHRLIPCGHILTKSQTGPPHWKQALSTRQNQDNQREYEECAVQKISAVLTRRICGEAGGGVPTGRRGMTRHRKCRWSSNVTPPGGTYVRLEKEWKEVQLLEKRSQNLYFGHHKLDRNVKPNSAKSHSGISMSTLYRSHLRIQGHHYP